MLESYAVNYGSVYTLLMHAYCRNLMDALRFDHEDTNEINLGQLETTLQNALAAVFWRGKTHCANEADVPLINVSLPQHPFAWRSRRSCQ